jgi:hypothetical protein
MGFLSYFCIFRAIWNKSPYEGCPQPFIEVQYNSTYSDAGCPDYQLSGSAGTFGKFTDNSTTLNCFEITGYQIKYSTVLWLLELQIRRGRKF